MAYKLIVTEAAHQDQPGRTLDYIVNQLGNRSAAANLFAQVEQCYEQLRTYPQRYEACRDMRLSSLGYRKAVIGNYIMIYRPAEEKQTVYILRFIYGGRDYEKLI